MKNIREIKTTIMGAVIWLVDALYFALPYFSRKELWETNSVWVAGLFIGGLLLMLAPDRLVNFLFSWMKKKADQG